MAYARTHTDADQALSALQVSLESHFRELRAARDRKAAGAPVFAMEHGLCAVDQRQLKTEIGAAVLRGHLAADASLPFVVYAAEIGYAYAGDEYWRSFETQTPGWRERGDRHFVRTSFERFAADFGGARPTGAWAAHFSIICWPITHAVLPTDLQRQLARLLFDCRRALTGELLASPPDLGRYLAARTWHASSRFRTFAENTTLLGQVASALLADADDTSPYLLQSTLRRMVADLSEERDARDWLRGARSIADRVRTKGLTRADDQRHKLGSSKSGRARSLTDPELLLLREAGAWTSYLKLPDLSILAEQAPTVRDELADRRAIFAGGDGQPLARGRLLYSGQQIRISRWPDPRLPLLRLEGGSDAANSVLAEDCTLTPGPPWLFRIKGPGVACEVRGKRVRPGSEYVLLGDTRTVTERPPWITETPSGTQGIEAYALSTPTTLGADDLTFLRAIGLSSAMDIVARPVGNVPPLWDGDGRGEWIAGETPLVGIRTTRESATLRCVLDEQSRILQWDSGGEETFLECGELTVGVHRLAIELLETPAGPRVASGTFELLIRPPHTRPPTGSVSEGIMLLATPVTPTLGELWDGTASLEIHGPVDVEVDVDVRLTDRSRSVLAAQHTRALLPITPQNWSDLFGSHFRQQKALEACYDEAESCAVTVSRPDLGLVSLQCAREFAALRWAFGSDRDGAYARLISNVEDAAVVQLFEFFRPDRPKDRQLDAGSRVRNETGGLLIARAGENTALAILSPTVRDLHDLRKLGQVPTLHDRPRSVLGVYELITTSHAWAQASLPANPFGLRERDIVVRAITARLAGLIGGGRWDALERRVIREDDGVRMTDLLDAVGQTQHQKAFALALRQAVDALGAVSTNKRAQCLAKLLSAQGRSVGVRHPDPSLAEFLVRLARSPGSLGAMPRAVVEPHLAQVLESPVLLRAARYLELTDSDESDQPEGTEWR